MDIVKVFGDNLKKYRTQLGLSQEAFAEKYTRGIILTKSPPSFSVKIMKKRSLNVILKNTNI